MENPTINNCSEKLLAKWSATGLVDVLNKNKEKVCLLFENTIRGFLSSRAVEVGHHLIPPVIPIVFGDELNFNVVNLPAYIDENEKAQVVEYIKTGVFANLNYRVNHNAYSAIDAEQEEIQKLIDGLRTFLKEREDMILYVYQICLFQIDQATSEIVIRGNFIKKENE